MFVAGIEGQRALGAEAGRVVVFGRVVVRVVVSGRGVVRVVVRVSSRGVRRVEVRVVVEVGMPGQRAWFGGGRGAM